VEQLPPLQPEQELPLAPGTALGTPPRVALRAEKVDILRLAVLWHFGHSAGRLHWLNGRICSNLFLQSEHTYSYIGISVLLLLVYPVSEAGSR
jgi:hypothetical protein